MFFALQVKATADKTGLSDAYVRDYFAKKVRPKTTHNFAIPWYADNVPPSYQDRLGTNMEGERHSQGDGISHRKSWSVQS